MSSSGQGAPGDKKDEPRGLKKFMRRASLVLRPKSKRQSISDASAFAPKQGSGAAGESSMTAAASPPAATSAPSVPAQITQVIKDNKPASTPIVRMTPKETSAIQEQKAKAVFAKYGLILEPGEWTTPVAGGAPRVEKLVRLRIHRTCHRCQTTFGSERLCSNCQHTRCKKCPGRSKPKAAKGKGLAAGGIAVDDGNTKNEGASTMSHRSSGKEVTRRTPTQRVRRTCHECQTLFVGKAVQCEKCKHNRCPKCPRDPPKTSKYADGYPGDTVEEDLVGQGGRKPIQTEVSNPPSRGKRPEDQAAIESVEARMKSLDISSQASAA